MRKFYVEFETTEGDELDESDLKDATWKVVEMFVDIDEEGEPVLTMRIEVHSLDMLQPPISPQDVKDILGPPYDWEQEDSGVRDDDPDEHEGDKGGEG